jgi:hypothetical protein
MDNKKQRVTSDYNKPPAVAPPYVPPIIPGEPHTKFIPKKLLITILFFSCVAVILFALWLGNH